MILKCFMVLKNRFFHDLVAVGTLLRLFEFVENFFDEVIIDSFEHILFSLRYSVIRLRANTLQ